jgi:hypothetical protein
VGTEPLKRARDAWDASDYDGAPGLYQDALSEGGLSQPDVVEAYVRMGAGYAITGKKKPALAAFRRAALLDPGFRVPPEAIKKGWALAAVAKHEAMRTGPLSLTVRVAGEVDSGTPFAVEVALEPAAATFVEAVTLHAADSLDERDYDQRAGAAPHVRFDVPTRMTLPDATIVLHVDARDAHDNQLVSLEKRVHVSRVVAPAPPAPTPLAVLMRPSTWPSAGEAPRPGAEAHHGGGGFWSSPWPYVIGGVALAAGGAAIWYYTRPTDDVTVNAARVGLSH